MLFGIVISSSDFIFEKFRNPFTSLKYINLAEKSFPSQRQSFKIFILRKKIMKWNMEIYKNSVRNPNSIEKTIKILSNFEKMIQVQDLLRRRLLFETRSSK